MLVNYTHHPSTDWCAFQTQTALNNYGEIKDLAFPHIDPNFDTTDLRLLAKQELKKILALKPKAVHIMGEMNFTFQMVYFLMQEEIECIASTTNRVVEKLPNGDIKKGFEFVEFRRYQFFDSIDTRVSQIKLTSSQHEILDRLLKFMESNDQVFILKGYAGTGKTTLMRFFVNELKKRQKEAALLATTGRASVVLEAKTNLEAKTLHSEIYGYNKMEEDVKKVADDSGAEQSKHQHGQLLLNFNTVDISSEFLKSVYIVDEASMLTNTLVQEGRHLKFGSGRLINDTLEFIKDKKLIFVGDPCQLPPVGSPISDALNPNFFSSTYENVTIQEGELTEVLRQAENSEILQTSLPIRDEILNGSTEWPKIDIKSAEKDIELIASPQLLADRYLELFKVYGEDHCIYINHKNADALASNQYIRQKLHKTDKTLVKGDILMVSKNCMKTKLKNGDQVVVEKVLGSENYKGFNYIDARVKALSDGKKFTVKVFEKLLNSSDSSLPEEDSQRLLFDFVDKMRARGVKYNSLQFNELMREDEYLNGIQAKYGYAITLHKAQGGEWKHTFLDVRKSVYRLKFEDSSETMLKWFYTGITRAQQKLYITNGSWIK